MSSTAVLRMGSVSVEIESPRCYPLIDLPLSTIKTLVEPHLHGLTIDTATLLTTGYNNTHYKLIFNEQPEPLILRIYTRSQAACPLEANLFEKIKNKIPVPVTTAMDTSCKIIDYPFALQMWLAGDCFIDLILQDDRDSLAKAFKKSGELLGRLTHFKFPGPGQFNSDVSLIDIPSAYKKNNIYLVYLMENLAHPNIHAHLDKEKIIELKDFIINTAEYLPEDNHYLTHGDFKPTNILLLNINDDWHITGLLDWEFCASGSYYFDIATFMRYDYLYSAEEIASFITGFEKTSNITLPNTWKKTAKVIDLANLCETLTHDEIEEKLKEQTIDLINKTMNDWDIF
jgi:Ser/Thr protein kinase RdoA (MazF antagonist)